MQLNEEENWIERYDMIYKWRVLIVESHRDRTLHVDNDISAQTHTIARGRVSEWMNEWMKSNKWLATNLSLERALYSSGYFSAISWYVIPSNSPASISSNAFKRICTQRPREHIASVVLVNESVEGNQRMRNHTFLAGMYCVDWIVRFIVDVKITNSFLSESKFFWTWCKKKGVVNYWLPSHHTQTWWWGLGWLRNVPTQRGDVHNHPLIWLTHCHLQFFPKH
jgi:hypothetical protein